MKRFNLWLYENNTHSIETLRELRAQEVARALEMKVFDFTPIPSQRVVNEMSVELIKDFLPYGYEITDDFKVDYARFRRYAYRDGVVVKLNYKEYGKYIHHHYDDFGDDRLHAIFELDMMLFLINQEMERLNPELVKNPVAQPADDKPEAKEELFHFVHPSLDDEEGWKIHNEVKRLVKRQSIQEICLYLKGMAKEKKVLLPQMPSVAYAELVRMGMPSSDGFTESTFRKYYENK